MIIWDKAEVIKVSDNALEHLEVPHGDKGCRYCTKMLRWGKKRHSAFTFQAEIDQLLSLNINTFCYTVKLEEIGMMISEIDSDGNAHIDLNDRFGNQMLMVHLQLLRIHGKNLLGVELKSDCISEKKPGEYFKESK